MEKRIMTTETGTQQVLSDNEVQFLQHLEGMHRDRAMPSDDIDTAYLAADHAFVLHDKHREEVPKWGCTTINLQHRENCLLKLARAARSTMDALIGIILFTEPFHSELRMIMKALELEESTFEGEE